MRRFFLFYSTFFLLALCLTTGFGVTAATNGSSTNAYLLLKQSPPGTVLFNWQWYTENALAKVLSGAERLFATCGGVVGGTEPTDDFDGDGVCNGIDIDDDNDGVVDAVESPLCFYTVAEANIITRITSQFTSPDDNQSDNDIQMLHDGVATANFNFNAFTTAQNPTGSNLFTIEYTFPVKLATINVSQDISATVNANAVIVGSNDGVTWSAALSSPTLITATPIVFNITTTEAFKYYRIQTGSTPGALAVGNLIGEITHTLVSPYIPSANPKATCADANIDGDGFLPHLDLDTDGDGCSDGVEAGNTPYTNNNITTFNTGADANENGLLDQFENGTTGSVNYTSTYLSYAINASVNACSDSDNDAVLDVADIDDDNDGVLDTVETNVNTYLNTTCENNLLERIGYTAAFTLGDQVADEIGLIVGTDNSFSTGFPVGTVCGNISLGTSTPTFNAWIHFKFVNPYNTSQSVPLRYINLTSDCSGNNEIAEYDAYDINGKFLYNQSLTTPSYGANHCVTIQPPADVDVYSIRVRQVLSSAIISGISLKGVLDYQDIDTDNDGIPNRLDLDSDGDGCPDTKEAILYTNSSVAAIPGDVENGTGGVVTSTVNTPDAMVPGPYGSNGFADAIESAANPNAYMYAYTYNFLATSAINNPCNDTDGDGISDYAQDIDIDNDGIPNAIESPSCFFTEQQAMVIAEPVTSDFSWTSGNPLSNTYDQSVSTSGWLATGINIQNKALVTFNLPFVGSAVLESVNLNVSNVAFGTGTWQLEGLGSDNVWVALSAAQAMNTINTTFTFGNTLAPNAPFHAYRIKGVSNVNANTGRLNEFTIKYKNYQASLHPVNSGCNSDSDGDGVPNFQDRDSDGDGCPDAVEAVVSGNLIAAQVYNNGSGNVLTDRAVAEGPYGANGLADGVETSPESGITNYTNYYHIYATNNSINACSDSDDDGISNVFDLDDDNDGILDSAEENCPTAITSKTDVTVSIPSSIGYTFFSPRTIVNLIDGNSSLAVMGVPTGTLNNSEWFRVQFATPRVLTEWEIGHVTNQRVFNAASTYKVQGSVDGNNWVDVTGTLSYLNNGSGQGASSNIAAFPQNNSPYLFYRYFGITGASGGGYATEFYFREKNCQDLDTDGDGIANRLDLDSDGDGCADATEGAGGFTIANLVESTLPGGNSGATYTGQVSYGVDDNLGNAVDANGVPTVAGGGQAVGQSQIAGTPCPENEPCDLQIGGTVYRDINTSDGVVSGAAINGTATGLYMSLVNAGAVQSVTAVQADGTYRFTGLAPGSYQLVISTTSTGSTAPMLTPGSVYVAEGGPIDPVSGNSTGDGTADGITAITISCPGAAGDTLVGFGIDNAMPVTLVSLVASQSPEGTLLQWRTADEKDFDRFQIEQSAHPQTGFTPIGTVKGGGSEYRYLDAVKRQGASYYRLKMIDRAADGLDGSFTYSKIVTITNRNGLELFRVYPNPSNGHSIQIATMTGIDSYKIHDAAGRQVQAEMSGQSGSYKFAFDKGVQPGVYVITYKTGGQTISQQFVLSY